MSGNIPIHGYLGIYNPYITIGGQTAPPPGITLKGATFAIHTHDVLVQHIRVRAGDGQGYSPDSRDSLKISPDAYNVVIDHCSVSWGVDENVGIPRSSTTHDFTISNTIISEGLNDSIHSKGPHSMGMLCAQNVHNVSVIKNLIAQNANRNPSFSGNNYAEVINNVIYNARTMNVGMSDSSNYGSHNMSVICNVAIRGDEQQLSTPDYTLFVGSDVSNGTRIYVSDNVCEAGGNCVRDYKGPGITWLGSPEIYSGATILPTSNNQTLDYVLANVGACPAFRDLVDNRVVSDVININGSIIDSQDDVGGWPDLEENYRTLTLPSNPNGDDDGDGYTNLEEWLHIYKTRVEGNMPGDLNKDSYVDIIDLSIVTMDFGLTSGYDPRADTIQTGEIDIFDVVFVASRFT